MNSETEQFTIFDMLTELRDQQTPKVNNLKIIMEAAYGSDVKVDNCAVILNNKIVSIANFFKKNNMPFNVEYKDGLLRAETPLIQAIIIELGTLSNDAIDDLAILDYILCEVVYNHKTGKKLANTFNETINHYNDLCQKMYNYELETNLPKQIKDLQEEGLFIQEDLDSIKEDLEKLGLESVNQKLIESLKKA